MFRLKERKHTVIEARQAKIPSRALDPFRCKQTISPLPQPPYAHLPYPGSERCSMAPLRMLRPLALKVTPPSLPRFIRPYSSAVSATYNNLLITTPKPGVGLSTLHQNTLPLAPTSIADLADPSPM